MIQQLLHHDAAKKTHRCLTWLTCFTCLFLLNVPCAFGQEKALTVEDCMRYAVAHSHGLRQRELTLDNARATRVQAVGAFLPSLGASAGVQWNFGRAIDPETNTYTSVSTFNNGYGLSASLPVFDGFYRVHALRAARADVLLQKNALQAERDQVALQTYQAFVDVIYAQEAVNLAAEKLHESEMMMRRTQVMEEEGLKSPADVALLQAQQAADALTLTRQQNQLESNMLKLKEVMGVTPGSPSSLTPDPSPNGEGSDYLLQEKKAKGWDENLILDATSLIHYTLLSNRRGGGGEAGGGGASSLLQSYYNVQSARHNLRATRASLFPTISLSAGINSSYYRNLNMPSATPFGRQLKNNLGEYVSMSLSIPLFNRLGTVMSLRRAKNNLRIAEEQYAAKQTELDVLRRQAQLDVEAYCKESRQGEQKVAADSLAYELVRQQYTEGIASPIDLQTSSATLLQSRAALLQSRLMVGIKEMQRRYYEGEHLVPDNH